MLLKLRLPDVQDIKKKFPITSYEKGYDCFRNDCVYQFNVFHNERQDVKICSRVYGTKSAAYKVQIYINDSNKISGICSCSMKINCKHVIATLLKVAHQIQEEDLKKETALSNIEEQEIPILRPEPLSKDPKVNYWLKELNLALTEKNTLGHVVDKSLSLHYLLKITAHNPNELQLTLALAKRLKSGKLSAPKKFNEKTISHNKYLLPIDQELLVKIEVAKKYTYPSHYLNASIKGPFFEKLLPELIATGRCHWILPENPPLTLAQPEKAVLNWRIDESGCQELRPLFSNTNESFIIFFVDQVWCLNENTAAFSLLETGLDAQIAKSLLSAPKIPPDSIEDVANLLKRDVKLSTVAPPKILTKTSIQELKPVSCLRLSQASITRPGDYKSYYQLVQSVKPIATVVFKYDNAEIPWQDHRKVISHLKNETLLQFLRNEKIENNAIAELVERDDLTLIKSDQNLKYIYENKKIEHCFLINGDPLIFSQHTIPALRKSGWEIDIADDYPYRVVDDPIDDWYSSLDENAGYDWFNLELGITLKGEKINLLPVLQQLLKKLHADGNTLDNLTAKPVLAQLPDGRFIALPVERVRNILNVLVELYDSESLVDGNFLRLSKLHAARLLELEAAMGAAQLRWFGGEKLRQLAKKITQFSGIKSVQIPKQFQGQLRPYQQEGLNWLQFLREYEFGGILADDMGLGKTIQALSHLTVEKKSGRMKDPTLVIAPTSLMFNWYAEAERFSPSLKVLVLHGPDRKQYFKDISAYDLVFTTYPLLKHDKKILLKQAFHFLILDEAQHIKNSKSLSTQIVQQIQAKHRLCLTGTPLENHLGELWSLFHFMMPGLLGDEKVFNRLFRTPIEKHADQERREHLIRRISPFLLRRTKNNVVKELPEKVNMLRYVEIDGAQRDLYETIRLTMQKKVREEIAKLGLARSHIIILDALLKLRQVCCDPRLLKTNTAKKNKAKSAKLELLMTLLQELIEEGRRILLFSQFTEMLKIIEDELNKRKLAYVKLTGQTKDRKTPVDKFQNGEVSLFLISLKAGGTGLNLTAADTVIHYDPWWNPAVEDQATDRAHRIGQDKTVFVYKFVTKGTVEEKILEMQQNKRTLMEGLFSGNATAKLKLTEKDLHGFFEPLEAVKQE
jgi:SNF2 family DNA or RNA helicase